MRRTAEVAASVARHALTGWRLAVKPVDARGSGPFTGEMTPIWKRDAEHVVGTSFEPGRRRDVVVVGAGLTGLATALLLAREGLDVAVIEAGEVGELASGANTGKLTLLQGSVLSSLRRHHSARLTRAYVEANRDGAEWLTAAADELGVPYSRRTAYSYAQTPDGAESVHATPDLKLSEEAFPASSAAVVAEEADAEVEDAEVEDADVADAEVADASEPKAEAVEAAEPGAEAGEDEPGSENV